VSLFLVLLFCVRGVVKWEGGEREVISQSCRHLPRRHVTSRPRRGNDVDVTNPFCSPRPRLPHLVQRLQLLYRAPLGAHHRNRRHDPRATRQRRCSFTPFFPPSLLTSTFALLTCSSTHSASLLEKKKSFVCCVMLIQMCVRDRFTGFIEVCRVPFLHMCISIFVYTYIYYAKPTRKAHIST
jgi:hypothetical protein